MPENRARRRSRHITLAVLALLATLSDSPRSQPAGGVCRAPATAPPCAAAAGQAATEPDVDTGLGNPVHLLTGEKYLRETDLPAALEGRTPSFTRHYRSGTVVVGALGAHWTSEYDIQLATTPQGWRLTLADGRILGFDAQGNADPDNGRITPVTTSTPDAPPGTPRHVWRPGDGTQREFDTYGRLITVRAPARAPLRIQRHTDGPLQGAIHTIQQDQVTLTLHYTTAGDTPLMTRLDTPAGTFHYDYDAAPGAPRGTATAARLIRVQRPDGMRRHYFYEKNQQAGHPYALTGVFLADPAGRRWHARQWSYDARGRVASASVSPGAPDTRTLQFAYDLPGPTPSVRTTRIHNDDVQLDVDHATRGTRRVIMGARITACAGCPTSHHPLSRDAQGRLTAIGALRIQRAADGRIRRLQAHDGGWPGLELDYDSSGRRIAWTSALTGRTRTGYDTQGRLQTLRHANGDRLDIAYSPAGRPAQLHHTGTDKTAVTIGLQWHGPWLRRLTHPAEDEFRHYDGAGRLRARDVRRPHPTGPLQYRETFTYDTRGRLLRHALPEGGALLYTWLQPGDTEAPRDTKASGDTQGSRDTGWPRRARLASLIWKDARGRRHTVFTSQPGRAGYRFGNGLELYAHAAPARTDTRAVPGTSATARAGARRGEDHTLILSDGRQAIWGERRTVDAQGRVQTLAQADAAANGRPPATARIRQYAYDTENRMVGFREHTTAAAPSRQPPATWLAWAGDGAMAARRDASVTASSEQSIRRDASGLPTSSGAHSLHYSAQRLLSRVGLAGGTTLHMTHNAQGHTIRRRHGDQETERYYLDNRLVALWKRPAGAQAPTERPLTFGVTQRFLYADEVPVGLLQTEPDGQARLYYVHADLLGAPVLVTDATRAVRWSATYDALGRAHTRGDLDFPLRLPGQDEDPVTGWHSNIFRTYLPQRGHYLEPDPLGPLPGEQALGYAAQQPMRHVDPLGLILLAFDGTRYDAENQSNVWKLSEAYQDGARHYQAGPGKNTHLDWDAITASSSGRILRSQWDALLDSLQAAQGSARPVPIDILGYSRGAALARDFANRVARQTRSGWFSYDDPLRGAIGLCVDLRFLGLFDTVAQFGLLGAANAGYELGIPDAWHWVAHAVALHEFRTLFPLVMATGGAPDQVIEAPFIGAHADIGGGRVLDTPADPATLGDLSDVALNWMHWQALAARVPLAALAPEDQHVTNPLLHDERLPMTRILHDSDRSVQDAATQSLGLQRFDPRLGADQRQVFEAFIERIQLWQAAPGNVVGTVDMQGYGAWLQTALGLPR